MCHAELAKPLRQAIISGNWQPKAFLKTTHSCENTLCPCLKRPSDKGPICWICAMELTSPLRLAIIFGDRRPKALLKTIHSCRTPSCAHAPNVRAIRGPSDRCAMELANPIRQAINLKENQRPKALLKMTNSFESTTLCPCLKCPSDKAGHLINVPWS